MGTMNRMPSVGTSLRLVIQASVVVMVAGAAAFLYVRLRETIISGFDSQLVAAGSTISAALRGRPVTACLEHAGAPDSVMRAMEEWRLLRSVQERADLTYAYTFLRSGDSGIVYLVDGSPDGQTCAIGQEETLPAENTAGLRRAWSSGLPFVSRVLRFEQWGLLKVSAISVLDSIGRPAAMVGADLEVSIIRRRLRAGMFTALGVSMLVIALSWLLAYYTERRLLGAVRATMRSLVAVAGGDNRALLPCDPALPVEIAGMNVGVNRWLTASREALRRHDGASPEDRPWRVAWRTVSPDSASCAVLGDYVVAWCRARGESSVFFFGAERGPVALIHEYLRPLPAGAGLAWTNPSGLGQFFSGVWWLHTGSGRTGILGETDQPWLSIVRGGPREPDGEILVSAGVQETA